MDEHDPDYWMVAYERIRMVGRKRNWPDEIVDKWIKLLESGELNRDEICERWGVDKTVVYAKIYERKSGSTLYQKRKLRKQQTESKSVEKAPAKGDEDKV